MDNRPNKRKCLFLIHRPLGSKACALTQLLLLNAPSLTFCSTVQYIDTGCLLQNLFFASYLNKNIYKLATCDCPRHFSKKVSVRNKHFSLFGLKFDGVGVFECFRSTAVVPLL